MYDLLEGILFIILSLLARAACPRLTVTKAEANANGNGVYIETTMKVVWAPTKPVYRNIAKNMYLYYNTAPYGWTIGTLDHVNKAWILHSGRYEIYLNFEVVKYIQRTLIYSYDEGGPITQEPWQAQFHTKKKGIWKNHWAYGQPVSPEGSKITVKCSQTWGEKIERTDN